MSYNFSGVFPPVDVGFTEKEASQYYDIAYEENVKRNDTSGGYELTRPQFTRKPRKTFKTGFVEMSASDFDIFEKFFEKYQLSKSFTWFNQASQSNHTVRINSAPNVTWRGIGSRALYNVEVELKEV